MVLSVIIQYIQTSSNRIILHERINLFDAAATTTPAVADAAHTQVKTNLMADHGP